MKTFKMDVTGFKELDDALADLGKTTARNVLKRAGRKAMQPVADAAKGYAPERRPSDNLKESIIVSEKLNKPEKMLLRGSQKYFAELHAGPKWPQGAHGSLVEFGTNDRQYTTASGRVVYTGSTSPNPFMRNAWHENKHRVLATLAGLIREEIEKAQKRAANKAAKIAKKAAAK